jgi:hypothetical protein
MNTQDNWKNRTMLFGALIGAVAGIGAAYLLIQRAEKEGAQPQMTAGEGVKLGLLVLGVLRQVAQLGE